MGKRTAKQASSLDPIEETKTVEVKSKGVRRKEKAETKAVERLTRQSSGATAAAEAKKANTASEGGSGCISVMLAHNYDPDKHNPTGWLMSEKLDGVRCYWDGATMYTR